MCQVNTVCKKTFVSGSVQRNRQRQLIVVTVVILHSVRLHALNTIFNAELEGNCWTYTATTVSLFSTAHNYIGYKGNVYSAVIKAS